MNVACQYPSPDKLIHGFQQLIGQNFQTLDDVRDKIKEISQKSKLRYVSFSTGKSRKRQIFCCSCYFTDFDCRSKLSVEYSFEQQKIIHISFDSLHSHKINQIISGKKRNVLTKVQKETIKNQTTIGVPAARIRLNLGFHITKDTLYSQRRKFLKDEKTNEMENMIIEMNNWLNWSNIIVKNDENEFLSAYVFHDRIVETNY